MIDLKQLRQLIRLMTDNELTELHLQDGEEQVTLKRGPGGVPQVVQAPAAIAAPPVAAPPASSDPAPAGDAGGSADDGLVPIMSPMVGTFYSSPTPDSDPFVGVGSKVSPDANVCIIEAMKVFNEIKAEVSGTIERVMVENGQAVDCDTQLFLVRPN